MRWSRASAIAAPHSPSRRARSASGGTPGPTSTTTGATSPTQVISVGTAEPETSHVEENGALDDRIVITSRDEGVSGSHGADLRTGLHNALVAVKGRTVDGLVVYRLDRLARKLTVQEAALAKVWDLGGTVFAVDLGEVARDDPDDP